MRWMASLFAVRITDQKRAEGVRARFIAWGLSLIFLAGNFRCPYLVARSISPGKNRTLSRRFATVNTLAPVRALFIVLIEWNATHGSSRFFPDLGFAIRAPAPVRKGKSRFHCPFQLLVVRGVLGVRLAKCQRFVMNSLLNLHQQSFHRPRQVCQSRAYFPFSAWPVATRQHRRLLGHILGPQFHTQRHPAHLPIVKFPSRARPFAFI